MKKAIEFSVIVCLVSWLLSLLIYLVTGGSVLSPFYPLAGMLYMLLPMITAMLLQKYRYHEKFRSTGLLRMRIKGSWFVAWGLMPLMIAASVWLSTLIPGVEFSMEGLPVPEGVAGSVSLPVFYAGMILGSMVAGATINAVFAFGEEYGWKNFLVSALRKYRFWQVALFSGSVWGIWHFPLILMGHNYPSAPGLGVPMMVLFCVLLTFPMLYFTIKARSVVVAAVMHGTMNALVGLGGILLDGGTTFTTGLTGWPGFAVIIVTTGCLFLYDRYCSKEKIFTKRISESMDYPAIP